ncbi:hypothetical protein UFOVP95_11 [uncultured Caudovirales phage]|uniref:Uncharacterized protein n=1 Tax=uncultured Caudovirales phage TaxID=2100421 RepID=A0A6J5L2T9_9CAUD|nr:hypothetical protein UFOVP95_11 [uncultured Caudovirales phage]
MLKQAFRAVLKHAPNVINSPTPRLSASLVEADAELAQMISAGAVQDAATVFSRTLTLK